MPSGALTLAEYPSEVIVLACERCDRRGQFRKAWLVAEYGADIGLPELRLRLADDCPLSIKPVDNVGCGAIYPELVKEVGPDQSRAADVHR
jgi:hypothetical protein